ncbi:MAG: rhomboid family intramembrane serine protease [Kiritimatiellae bacterium]|nr:rhomboid family intramembrane serine protease [Kiritimatiellia bacterium]MDW8458507.1 rhomboid family intramembrane serine protease [Verrucomicrobiota bacterium]
MSYTVWRLRFGLPRATFAVLVALIGVYVLQIMSSALLGIAIEQALGLSVAGILEGHIWTFLTYQFLHGGPFHLLLNILMFVFLGAETERAIGTRHFLVLYFLSGILGGVGWLYLTYPYEGVCVGASAAIFGLLSAFAVLFPHREVSLLIFFIFPVTLKAWVLAIALGTVQLLFSISPNVGGVAYSAHLAGAVAGFIYTAVVFRPDWLDALKAAWRTRRREAERRAAEREDRRVDALLDKISREGIQSLTPEERRFLEEVSRRRTSR